MKNSKISIHSTYNIPRRELKAQKVLAILDDHFASQLESFLVLDIGCSTGAISNALAQRAKQVTGIDIDQETVQFAREHYNAPNLQFIVQDALSSEFPDESFDLVICNHIYEHVPDPHRLFSEIYRVLKPGGTCYLAAGNRLMLVEAHYRLPFLSMLPKGLSNFYLQIVKGFKYNNINFLNFWELKKLVSRFEIIDYTLRVINEPEKFKATEMLHSNTLSQKIISQVLSRVYWVCPTYLWLLRKSKDSNGSLNGPE